jgi:hypothetical protein
MFDKLYFIVDGRTAYFGDTEGVAAYFSRSGHAMAPSMNPSDLVMELFVDPENRNAAAARRLALCDAYTTTQAPAVVSAASNASLDQVDAWTHKRSSS